MWLEAAKIRKNHGNDLFPKWCFLEKRMGNRRFYWDLSVYLLRAKDRVRYKYPNENKIIYMLGTYIQILI